MSFIAGYLLGLGQGGSPPVPTPSPLSLEGINALKTLATVTVGDFVFEVKEPCLFYSGKMNAYAGYPFDRGVLENGWMPSVIVNDSVAAVGHDHAAVESFAWDNYTDNNGNSHSTYFSHFSDWGISEISVYKNDNILIGFNIKYQYTRSSGYDGVASDIYKSSVSCICSFYGLDIPILTNLNNYDYFKFVKAYCTAQAVSEPIITILS